MIVKLHWKHMLPVFLGVFGIVILDRLTKMLILSGQTLDAGFLSFHFVTNTGASFGMLQGWNAVFIAVSIVVLGILAFYYKTIPPAPLMLITGGVLGNLLDRIFFGFVIDFIDFKFFPVFNIADSAISIGVFVWILLLLLKKRISVKKL